MIKKAQEKNIKKGCAGMKGKSLICSNIACANNQKSETDSQVAEYRSVDFELSVSGSKSGEESRKSGTTVFKKRSRDQSLAEFAENLALYDDDFRIPFALHKKVDVNVEEVEKRYKGKREIVQLNSDSYEFAIVKKDSNPADNRVSSKANVMRNLDVEEKQNIEIVIEVEPEDEEKFISERVSGIGRHLDVIGNYLEALLEKYEDI